MTGLRTRLLLAMVVLGLVAGTSGRAMADITTSFNQTISGFDPPNSAGETNTGFEVTTNSATGDEIGLRISLRFNATPVFQTNNGSTIATYTVPTGTSPAPPTNAALWNIDYFALPGNNGTFGPSGYSGSLALYGLDGNEDADPPLTVFNSSAPNPNASQDSTNLGYFGLPSSVYNPNVPGTYKFVLTLTPPSGGTVLTETIILDVVATPEPSTLAMAASVGLAGLAYSWRRRKQSS